MADDNSERPVKPRRSQHSYGKLDRDGFIHRSWMKAQGLPDDVFDGRPVIGICNTWSELTPCNAHLREIAEYLKRGVLEAGVLPLELLAIAEPDMLIASTPYPRPSRAEEILDHPVVRHLAARTNTAQIRDADWVCGTPHVLNAVEAVAAERARFLAREGGT